MDMNDRFRVATLRNLTDDKSRGLLVGTCPLGPLLTRLKLCQ
jgi:hypothetical protein